MSLFIHPDNQTLLWKTIHQIPHVKDMEQSFKIEWFKSTIGLFHNSVEVVDENQLADMNKNTILHFCQDIKRWKTEEMQTRGGCSELPKIGATDVLPPPFASVGDEPINDLDKLLKQHMMEREIKTEPIHYGEIQTQNTR
jgi:hypothetical protein